MQEESKSKNKSWLVIAIIGIVLLLIAIVGGLSKVVLSELNNVSSPEMNELPMYGFTSYEDYMENRSEQMAGLNDEFVDAILNPEEEFDDGVEDEIAYASKYFVQEGFQEFRNKDYIQGMRRVNQSWLIAPENHNAYWGFAIWEKYFTRDCSDSKVYFEKAIELYDERYEIEENDKERLEIDYYNAMIGC